MINKLTPLTAAIAGIIAVSAAPALAKTSTQHEYVKDSLLVVYKDNATPSERASAQHLVNATIRDTNADGVDDRFAKLLNGKLARLSLRKGTDIDQAIKLISRHPAVKYAEPNYVIRVSGTPDDPNFSSLWGLNNTGQDGGTADADIDAPEAWDITTGDSHIVIGVIDSGVDYNHPDLQANMWVNPGEIAGNGIDDDGNGVIDDIYGYSAINDNGDPMDGNGHGTHVSGTIGATGNNGVGVVGVNWDVSIIGCQFLDAGGSGSTAGAIACIDYMTDLKINHGVNIKATNNSWGGGAFSQALKDAIDAGGEAGILFVAASGNDGTDNDAVPSYPASYESDVVFAVANTNRDDNMSGTSQYGLTSVDMGAPGSSILSTVPGGGYASYSGTSMASPHVAGAAALVWSINPDLTPVEMKELLMISGDANAALTGKTVAGTRLNVANALEQANPEPGYRFMVTPMTQRVEVGSAVSYDFNVGSVAGWDGEVALTVETTPALNGVSLSSSTVGAGDDFTLNVATEAEAAWGDYQIVVTGDDGATVKSKVVSLSVYPQGLNDIPYDNEEVIAIPDDNSEGITSIINVADPVFVFGLTADVNITHTWIGDLVVKLTSPAGTEVVLHNRDGGGADDIVKSWVLSDFDGEMATGDWTLSITDNVSGDTGTLNNWGLVVTALGDAAPAAPVASFEYAIEGLNVNFSNTSSDINDDIVSYQWDFGDGAGLSSEVNPVYSYAGAGVYTVTLMVTDSEGRTDTYSNDIELFERAVSASVVRTKLSRRGSAMVDLNWDSAIGESVVIYRNGEAIATTANDGNYRDRFSTVEGEVFGYVICETDSNLCSDIITVQF